MTDCKHLSETKQNKALIDAVTLKHKHCVDLLIKAGADVNTRNNYGESVLIIASREGSKECIVSLVKGGTKVKVKSFVEGKPITLLEVTVTVSDAECLKLLLGNDIPVNGVISAVVNAHYKYISSLVKAGASLNVPVTHNDHLDSFTCLEIMKQECGINSTDVTTVITPFDVGENPCLELLLNSGADVNTTDSHGRTPLMMTSTNKKFVSKLIQHGALVNKADDNGMTSLMHALLNSCRAEVTELFLGAGADVNATNVNNMSVLTHAALANDGIKNINVLLKYGILINIRNVCGQNALEHHLAICGDYRDEKIVRLLFAAGESLDVRNVQRNAWIVNREHRKSQIAWQLQSCSLNGSSIFCLQCKCREAIRHHLLKINLNKNFFQRIPKLGLPAKLKHYLLYGTSLDFMEDYQ